MLYEAILLFAVGFFAAWLFFFASGGRDATAGWLRSALQLFIDATPRTAMLRFLLALFLVPTGISIVWALFDRERQFLHDRLAGTRLVSV